MEIKFLTAIRKDIGRQITVGLVSSDDDPNLDFCIENGDFLPSENSLISILFCPTDLAEPLASALGQRAGPEVAFVPINMQQRAKLFRITDDYIVDEKGGRPGGPILFHSENTVFGPGKTVILAVSLAPELKYESPSQSAVATKGPLPNSEIIGRLSSFTREVRGLFCDAAIATAPRKIYDPKVAFFLEQDGAHAPTPRRVHYIMPVHTLNPQPAKRYVLPDGGLAISPVWPNAKAKELFVAAIAADDEYSRLPLLVSCVKNLVAGKLEDFRMRIRDVWLRERISGAIGVRNRLLYPRHTVTALEIGSACEVIMRLIQYIVMEAAGDGLKDRLLADNEDD